MNILSKSLLETLISTKTQNVTVTVVPSLDGVSSGDLSGVSVSLTAEGYSQVGRSITVPIGTVVSWEVSCSGYKSRTGTVFPVGNTTLPVNLTSLTMYTVTIRPFPLDSVVTLAGEGGYEQTEDTNSITVPEDTTVSYVVAKSSLDSFSGSLVVSKNKEIDVVLNATITLVSDPEDAVKKINNKGSSLTVPCNTSPTWEVSKDGYISQSGTIEKNNDGYIVTQTVNVVLEKQTYLFAISALPVDATISITVDGNTITDNEYLSVRATEGTEVYWKVERSGYTAAGSDTVPWVMLAEDKVISVSLAVATYNVSITSTPSSATITLTTAGGVLLASGEGYVYTAVETNTAIRYVVEFGGVSVTRTAVVAEEDFTDNVPLGPETEVVLVTEKRNAVIQPGKYYYLAIGAGAGGNPGRRANSSSRASTGGYGGGGGGSGYISMGYFTVEDETGKELVLSPGSGGEANKSGEKSTITDVSGNDIITPADGGKAEGNTTNNVTPGGSGGSGGGAGGRGGQKTGNVSIPGVSGGNGAYGGGNGASTSIIMNGITYVVDGGQGYYRTTKSYESNAGSVGTSSFGNPGKGGRGLMAMSSFLTTLDGLLSATNLQELYNNLGGGGGGGATVTPGFNASLSGNWFGGPGGGGGGWFAGEDGKNSASDMNIAGKGGDGAILYARVSWE